MKRSRNVAWTGVLVLVGMVGCGVHLQGEEFPKVGDAAGNFTLKDVGGKDVELKALWEKGPVVVLFLRGFPGYQCPLCTKQVADFSGNAKGFAEAGGKVLLVYPGGGADLKKKGMEFLGAKELPENMVFVTDPDYRVTKAWKLRWEAPLETAYPSTFVIDSAGKIRYAKVSKSHGGRTKSGEILEVVRGLGVK